jgi:hypothetical protein
MVSPASPWPTRQRAQFQPADAVVAWARVPRGTRSGRHVAPASRVRAPARRCRRARAEPPRAARLGRAEAPPIPASERLRRPRRGRRASWRNFELSPARRFGPFVAGVAWAPASLRIPHSSRPRGAVVDLGPDHDAPLAAVIRDPRGFADLAADVGPARANSSRSSRDRARPRERGAARGRPGSRVLTRRSSSSSRLEAG